MALVVVMGSDGDKGSDDGGDVTYKYFIILFILQGKSEVIKII